MKPSRILIVDDDDDNRELFEVILISEGFTVQTAASGEEALGSVALQAPDLILLDVMMPGMTGYEVVAEIKANRVTRGIPVIIVTALNDRYARTLALGAGAEDFLPKPVGRAELCAHVKTLLHSPPGKQA